VADEKTLSTKDFGALFKNFLEEAVTQASAEKPFFQLRLQAHFGEEPSRLPTVSENIEKADHPNLHLAVETYLAEGGRTAELIGMMGGEDYREPSIAALLLSAHGGPAASQGPVQYANVALADAQVLPCVARGLYLIADGDRKYALLIASPDSNRPFGKLRVEVMTRDHQGAVQLLRDLRAAMRKRSVYRGQVVSLMHERNGDGLAVQFNPLRPIERENIVLPSGVLERIERQTIGFSRHREALLAAGRHLKRGMLLYGPPGTGKTLTAMYLATQMKDRTTFLLTGRGLGLIEQSCAMARLLQPSTVILEDVDLVAEERTRQGAGCTALLFELLNQMDGLADDADVVFILTTNRPEILEPALASRPGRVDLAVEIPAPDVECRRRLIELYGRGLTMRARELERVVQKTEGVSAAFIRELLRKAALFAADESKDGAVEDRHLDAALHELVVQGGNLTRSLLGVRSGAGN
jgi:hypothetical protein